MQIDTARQSLKSGEDGHPNGKLGGEEREDDAQHIVREVADEVAACRMLPRIGWLAPPSSVDRQSHATDQNTSTPLAKLQTEYEKQSRYNSEPYLGDSAVF